jgi:hypothetical protein
VHKSSIIGAENGDDVNAFATKKKKKKKNEVESGNHGML